MRSPLVASTALVLVLLVACGSSSDDGGAGGGSSSADGGAGTSGDGGTGTGATGGGESPALPTSSCALPAALVDTSAPTTKVGTGTAASCTEAALRAAVAAGGVVTFDCGADPVTVVVKSPLTPPTAKDTVIDGGGKVTLSGGDTSRIVSLQHSFEKASPTLTVQRITLAHGASSGTGPNDGGAAISVLGANVVAIEATFVDNHGPAGGQDTAGGAINNVGAGKTTLVGSRFERNTCSNGGAVGILGGDLTIVNTVIANNSATGTGGNPGGGGNGGGASMDGQGKALAMCGVTFQANAGNAYGGAFFRSAYENEPTTIDQATFDGNTIPDHEPSQCGALWLQGTAATITRSTFVRNAAKFVGAISVYAQAAGTGKLDMTNVTIADNRAWPQSDFTKTGLVGGITVAASVSGTWRNVTIAGNSAQFASGIGGVTEKITIENSIVSNVAANEYTPLNCNGTAKGQADLQWPATNKAGNDTPCVTGIQRADPLLGELTADRVRIPGAGSPALGLGKSCPATDQLGHPRKAEGCTAGAVEVD